MIIKEITDKNQVWQQLTNVNVKNAIDKTEILVNDYLQLVKLLSTSIIKNSNLPGLLEIKTAITSLAKELNDYPDPTDPDIIAAKNKIVELEALLNN